MRRLMALALFAAIAAATPGHAQDKKSFTPQQQQEIERIVRDYLKTHPEVIIEAAKALEAKEQEAQQQRAKVAIEANRDKLVNDPDSPVMGNPKGDVTVVEFFDYQCPYCKKMTAPLNDAMAKDGKLRVVFKEWPVLGPESLIAAKASLASQKQGKYKEFHNALMDTKGRLNESMIMSIAEKTGLDTKRLKKDMEAPDVQEELKQNQALAAALQLEGTPAFVIGSQMAPGAINADTLKEMIDAARKN